MNSYTEGQQHFRSNRRHLRIRTDLFCEVGPPGGQLSTAQILDISIGGLKFSCSHETVNNIIPDGERTVGLIMDAGIDIQFKLPSDNESTTDIKTSARIIHSERLAQDVFHVGIQFNTLNINLLRQLEVYIEGLEL
ncbi:MAG: PilZ domain-containing protein [Pseudomonadota bacterium]